MFLTPSERKRLEALSAIWLHRFKARKEAIRQSGRITAKDLSIRVAALLLVLLLPGVAHAQVGEQPLAWDSQNRPIASAISNWAIVTQSVGTGYVAVKDWREGKHRTAYRAGCSIGLAMAISTPLKHLVSEPRPDGSDNLSWPSGHSTATAALSGWNFTVGVPVAALTGILKLDQNVHHPKDVLSGWAIGAGSQAICSALIR